MEIIYNLDEIENIAKKIVPLAHEYKIITFSGDLGAGKTTLINSICKQLGVEEIVNSPTYALIQEYEFGEGNIIYHMDLYRIKNEAEAADAGIEDCLLSGELCLVEWPQKVESIFPEQTVNVFLETLSPDKRKLVVKLP
jgi:ATPase, YjeE family